MEEKFKKIIGYLLKGKINFWKFASHAGYLPEFVTHVKKLKEEKFLEIKNSNLILTKEGKKLAQRLKINLLSLPPKTKTKIQDRKLLEKLKKIRKKEEYSAKFDQLPLSAETVIKKIEFIKEKGDLTGKKILCLGDDDFVGTALMLTKLPKEIGVLDIDPEILSSEKKFAKQTGFKSYFFLHNLVRPLPKEIKGKYDVFVTEPPDTVPGHLLFFSRAIESLKKEGGVGYLGITSASLSLQQQREIQKKFLEMGGVITDILYQFEDYETIGDEFEWISGLPEEISLPKENWYFANLWRIEIIKPRPLIKGEFKKSFIEKALTTKFNF